MSKTVKIHIIDNLKIQHKLSYDVEDDSTFALFGLPSTFMSGQTIIDPEGIWHIDSQTIAQVGSGKVVYAKKINLDTALTKQKPEKPVTRVR